MRKFKLWLQFMKFSLSEIAIYRADFVFRLFSILLMMGMMYVVLSLPYKYVGSIAGWDKDDAMILLGIYYMSSGLSRALFRTGIGKLELMINKGTFDRTLLKPVDSMFLVSFFLVDISRMGDVLVSLGFIIIFVSKAELSISLLSLVAAVAGGIGGLVLMSKVFLMVNTLCFWTTETYLDHVVNPLFVVTKYPVDIWDARLKNILYWGVPLAFVSTVPASILTGKLPAYWSLIGIGLAIIWSIAARLFWNFALRRYSSVGS